jgi:alanyl-tRNA synthetase
MLHSQAVGLYALIAVPATRAGLRAVFGEVYPDPVRVVAIGAPVEDLLARPADAGNRRFSVEFCGGTHLGDTGEARAFALLSEEGVAKARAPGAALCCCLQPGTGPYHSPTLPYG